MKKIILTILIFSVTISTVIAQEIDYNKLAKIFKKEYDTDFISQLKKVADKPGGLELLNNLINVNTEIKTLRDNQNTETAEVTRKAKNLKSQINSLRDKSKTHISESKRLANKRDYYRSLANKAKNNYYKFSSLGGASKYRRNHNEYIDKAKYYNTKLRRHNNSLDIDELRRKDKMLVRKVNNMLTNNKANVNRANKKVKVLQSKRYNLKNQVYQMMLSKVFKKLRERNNPIKEKKVTVSKFSSKMVPKKELANWVKQGDNLQVTKLQASNGFAHSQRRLARIYNYVYKDQVKGIYWRKKAAINGDSIAQSNLGYDYHYGSSGLKQDYKEAAKWYRKSALQGHSSGQHNLAVMYENGYGVKKDYYVAEVWYRKAANQGHKNAQNRLGTMYEEGTGVEKNYDKAEKWYRKAANQGYAYAQFNLAEMYYYGRSVNKSYSQAIKWYHKAANQGHASAQYSLGYVYNKGQGVNRNKELAIKWYKKAAKQGNQSAKRDLEKFGVQ